MILSGIKTIEVEKGSAWFGERIDLAVLAYLESVLDGEVLSRTTVSKFIPIGVYVDDKHVKQSYRIRLGDSIKIDLYALNTYLAGKKHEVVMDVVPVKGDLNIVEETEEWLVLNKVGGVAVHPSAGNFDNTLANYVKEYLISKNCYDDKLDRAGVVHRLDKPVSGLILFAKTREFQEYAMKQFEEKSVVKKYLATVEELEGKKIENIWAEGEEKVVEGSMRRDPGNRLRRLFNPTGGGKFAASRVKYIGNNVFEVEIFTGRTHQIRATLRYLGFVVNGDSLYGSKVVSVLPNSIDLKCIFLEFKDSKGEVHTYELN